MKYFFNNARNALRIFLRNSGVKEIWVPYEICSVLFKAIRDENIFIKFYHIDNNFKPIKDFGVNDYVLYPNYFGICDDTANALALKYKNFIYDATQSFFAKPLGIATIYSARKFLPVTDGGILITNLPIKTNFKRENHYKNFSIEPRNFDYENFLKNELRFNRNSEIKLISQESEQQIIKIDLKRVQEERIKNFKKLHECFQYINAINIPEHYTSPMVYPLKTSINIAQKLMERGFLILQYEYLKDIIPMPLKMAGYLPAIKSYLQI